MPHNSIEPRCVIIGSRNRHCSSCWRLHFLFLSLSLVSSIKIAGYEIKKFKSPRYRLSRNVFVKLKIWDGTRVPGMSRSKIFHGKAKKRKRKKKPNHCHRIPPSVYFRRERNPPLVSSRLAEPNPNLVSPTERAYLVRCWRTHDRS